jgi:hypothetical protein
MHTLGSVRADQETDEDTSAGATRVVMLTAVMQGHGIPVVRRCQCGDSELTHTYTHIEIVDEEEDGRINSVLGELIQFWRNDVDLEDLRL